MNYDGTKVCAVADHIGGGDCKWPTRDVKVFAKGSLGGVDLENATEQALEGWNKVCGINLSLTANQRASNINVTQGGIDGPQGTLAWSELPCFGGGAVRQLQQKYDTGEMWTVSENPPSNKIDAVRVICHEVGHAIGLSHISDGNLLAPTYNAQIRWPQRGDIAEARSRYGLPREEPKPSPQPSPQPSICDQLFGQSLNGCPQAIGEGKACGGILGMLLPTLIKILTEVVCTQQIQAEVITRLVQETPEMLRAKGQPAGTPCPTLGGLDGSVIEQIIRLFLNCLPKNQREAARVVIAQELNQ